MSKSSKLFTEIDLENVEKEKFQMTREEMQRFKESMKNEEFKKLFFDYMEELQDPKNREIYENELQALELSQGSVISYIHPSKHHCLKLFINKEKYFINICSCRDQEIPKSTLDNDGKYQVPYSSSVGRKDIDNKGNECFVYDVIFNLDTLERPSVAFRKMVNQIAVDAVLALVKKNTPLNLESKVEIGDWKELKELKCKGEPCLTISRDSKNIDKTKAKSVLEPLQNEIENIKKQALSKEGTPAAIEVLHNQNKDKPKNDFIIPSFKIIHQTMNTDYKTITTPLVESKHPDYLIIKVQLPGIRTISEIDLELTSKTMSVSAGRFKINLDLPHKVLEGEGEAGFEKSKSELRVRVKVEKAIAVAAPTLVHETVETNAANGDNEIKNSFEARIGDKKDDVIESLQNLEIGDYRGRMDNAKGDTKDISIPPQLIEVLDTPKEFTVMVPSGNEEKEKVEKVIESLQGLELDADVKENISQQSEIIDPTGAEKDLADTLAKMDEEGLESMEEEPGQEIMASVEYKKDQVVVEAFRADLGLKTSDANSKVESQVEFGNDVLFELDD